MIRVDNILIEWLKAQGFHPNNQILENQISKAYEKSIEKHGMNMERVLKEAHWCNSAKKAIQTTQNHLKAILAGCDNSFLMHVWDRLLPQAELTCNLLHPVNINQSVSAYQYVYGNHDYNNHPHHPHCCKVQAFIDTKIWQSWEEKSKDGYYVGTSMKHHQTYDVWIKATRSVDNTNTAYFKHAYITKPKVTKTDIVVDVATKLIRAIKWNYEVVKQI